MNTSLVFDPSSILNLIRRLHGEALAVLRGSKTLSLAYYEIGNALWRESFLLRRVSEEEAGRLLQSLFVLLRTMDVVDLDEDLGKAVLETAGKLNITYYDAAYLTQAQRSAKELITDDEKLRKAAQTAGIESSSSKMISSAP
jgi:predicted nucleic acid-binding protein